MLDFKTPELEADLKALKTLEDTLEQARIWTYNVWYDADEALAEREENDRFIKLLKEATDKLETLEPERKKLVALIESRLKTKPPAPAKSVDAQTSGKATVKATAATAKKTVRAKTKTQLIADATRKQSKKAA
jgi:hypothetical protein